MNAGRTLREEAQERGDGTLAAVPRCGFARLAGVAALVVLLGCVSPRDGGVPGAPDMPRRNWWNYYERGKQRLNQGDCRGASEDFERALGIRRGARFGYPREKWRAKTYGLHFVEGYFPHRELGICLYRLGRDREAVSYLETSLKQTPSGRAKYYLNLARRRGVTGRQMPAPRILIDPSAGGPWTRERTRTVSGRAEGAAYVRALRVDGRPRFVELAEPRLAFREDVSLRAGTNTVEIEATDLSGQTTTERVRWIADWRPPQLLILGMQRRERGWVLSAQIADDLALAAASVDGISVLPADAAPSSRVATVDFPIPPDKAVVFVAEDAAGNGLRTVLSADALREEMSRSAPAQGRIQYAMAAESAAISAATPGVDRVEAADRLAPRLRVECPSLTNCTGEAEFFIYGEASDGGGLKAVTIEGESQFLHAPRQAPRWCRFARRLPLRPGTNGFEIAAEDLAANRAAVRLCVIRQEPEYLSDEYRLRVAVPPLVSNECAAALRHRTKGYMEQELLRSPVRFRLLERTDEAWGQILREHEMSASLLSDRAAALRIGRMLPAEMLFIGEVLPEAEGWTVFARAVETAGGEQLLNEDVYSAAADDDLRRQVEGLVLKIKQRFPLVFGEVVDVSGGDAIINVGREQGISAGARFVVLQAAGEAEGSLGRRVRTFNGTCVELDVHRALAAAGRARILPPGAKNLVRKGDGVYAR